MKKYSSKQAKKGRTAYRTPSRVFNRWFQSDKRKGKKKI